MTKPTETSAARVSLPKEHFDLLMLAMKRNTLVFNDFAKAMKTGEARAALFETVSANTQLILLIEREVA
jgi:hypothetical protein